MSLVDANGNSMPTTTTTEPGSGAPQKTMDVRVVPFGTLNYNFIRAAIDELFAANAIQQVMAMKEQQKMVADPPQLEVMKEHLELAQRHRYIMGNEINERMRLVDQARREEVGLGDPNQASQPSTERSAS